MLEDGDGLALDARLPALELARLQRRVVYLEAALVQVLRDERGVREWFTAGELADLALPGLPRTASGVARLARRAGWESRIADGRGERVTYHFASLPRRAFAAILDRIMQPPGEEEQVPTPCPAPPRAAPPVPTNATPRWVLPLLRLMRGGLALEEAVNRLPPAATMGRPAPAAAEARDVLRALGVLAG